jgi:probable HAF family extracellular repeat protein
MKRRIPAKRVAILSLVYFSIYGQWAAANTTQYVVTDLGFGSPLAVNNNGVAVGVTNGGIGRSGALLFSMGNVQLIPGLPGLFNAAEGINDSGQVVGVSSVPVLQRAFLYSNGTLQDLGALPGKDSAAANDINNRGQVVGNSSTAGQDFRAFLYSDGAMTDLGTLGIAPGGTYSSATAINDVGQVVGFTATTQGDRAFLYSNGVMRDLGVLASAPILSKATDINVRGDVVGNSVGPNGQRAFLYSQGVMQDLGLLGMTSASGINDNGEVVGGAGERAVLYSGGLASDLNSLVTNGQSWVLQTASDISDAGDIVGTGLLNGVPRAYLASPVSAVPEPASRFLLFTGLVALAALRTRSTLNQGARRLLT